MGITWAEDRGNGLYFSVTLPSVEVGTVGGGTMLPTQRERLDCWEWREVAPPLRVVIR